MRVLQAANFVSATSGGLRTALDHLAGGYAAAGHEVVQLVPGPADDVVATGWGRRVVLRSPALVVAPGYRALLDRRRVRSAVERFAPDVLEVHDRTTLRWLGRWARAAGVPSLTVSHERLDRWVRQFTRLPGTAVADRVNAGLVADFDTVVCTTEWAAAEFRRIGAEHLVVVPLGVDAGTFAARTGERPGRTEGVRLVMASRLSWEKRPDLAVSTLRALRRRGVDARLVVAGEGPLRRPLQAAARGLPVQWLGYVSGRDRLAGVLADGDVALAPGPIETFGLAALEALACGTPVVASSASALPGVLGPRAGRSAAGTGAALADAVQDLLTVPEQVRREAARERAEQFPWDATVRGFLAVHEAAVRAAA
ncbi:glycosyltransferase [Modestobacter roseus]|uniref:Alpha-1,6-mannosyltransferase n=1 Tax=Modestobacter roseus TaxID=1181884 RepID=A0A562IPT0_9ACTN|nr:glycosyltransferase [Modestobacter roseus]MQA34486.1 glycosyltransferase [Modestobacter roseus]TWH73027.1 alpha-1,6-mannosyltransferase [Modestobacter roseus]